MSSDEEPLTSKKSSKSSNVDSKKRKINDASTKGEKIQKSKSNSKNKQIDEEQPSAAQSKPQSQKNAVNFTLSKDVAYIAHFSSAIPSASVLSPANDSDDGEGKLNFSAFRKAKKGKIADVLSGETDRMIYQGKVKREHQNTPANYVVGVYDRNTKKLELIPAPGIFHMIPFPKFVTESAATLFSEKPESKEYNNAVALFGNKQAKGLLKVQAGHRLIAKDDAVDTDASYSATEATNFEDLPPINDKDATMARDIWDWSAMIPEDVLESMPVEQMTKVVMNPRKLATFIEKESLNPIVQTIVTETTFDETDSDDMKRRCGIILFLSYLVQLRSYFGRKPGIAKLFIQNVTVPAPRPIVRQYLRMFTQESDREYLFAPLLRSKLVNTLCVLTFDALDYMIPDILVFAEPFGIVPEQLSTHFKRVGGVFEKGSSVSVTLTVPWLEHLNSSNARRFGGKRR